MYKTSATNYLSLSTAFILFLSMTGSSNADKICAHKNHNSLNEAKLAYFIGYHTYSRSSILLRPRPVYRASGAYWTGWRSGGYRCQKSCLIDKWTGLVVQCKRRC